ncbi:hypothetical protein LOSG293_170220 [Secundilactobacillus oryzae JCM 18671]|uniref:YtxH domain-containing protein n=1 Tax=Secundilactobacillus oryzae JCM 18671 TaxID=1291743 RepID=A0A081BJ02_9LACO|nr:YtxH domain-containing protein [Secundilactobacillus oryzae]GAK48020.1 hypothetical protein LOSG293_170220 [Secundilactobacillus oryzae JCM 18671]
MGKKGLVFGLLAAGAGVAYAKYRSLDEDEQREVREVVLDKVDAAKDRAVDYAFYANDLLDDLKDAWNDHKLQDDTDFDGYENASEDDDIILSSDDLVQNETPEDSDYENSTVTFTPDSDK